MLSYREMDNLASVEIMIGGHVTTEQFDATAKKLEAFIARHKRVRVLEIIKDFEGMDAGAFWQDLKFSLRHLKDFSRCAIVTNTRWFSPLSALAEPFLNCEVAYFPPEDLEAARNWLLWSDGVTEQI